MHRFQIIGALSRLRDWNDWTGFRQSLRLVESVKDEFVGSVRLSAPLGPEPEQVDASIAILHFKCGGLSLNAVGMQQVSAHQRILVFRIRGQNAAAEALRRLKGRAPLEHDDWVVRQTCNGGMRCILELDAEQRT